MMKYRRKLTIATFNLGVALAAWLLAPSRSGEAHAAELPAPRTVVVRGEKMPDLGFDRLSAFPYTIVDAGTGATPEQIAEAKKRGQLPSWLNIYSGQRVVLTGYMLPLQMENGRAKKFIMMKDVTTCCYGATPNLNDYVIVTMKGEGIKAEQDVPVMLVGVFHVAETYDNGYVVSLFQMDGENYLGPKT